MMQSSVLKRHLSLQEQRDKILEATVLQFKQISWNIERVRVADLRHMCLFLSF